jgi:hypothetical protein
LSKKTIALLLFLIAAPLIIYFIWPSDESRIRKLFREGTTAIEKEDLDAVMAEVSFNYQDDYGMTYLYLKEAMKSVFQKMDHIQIEYDDLKINVKDDAATAEADVSIIATIGTETGYVLGDAAKAAHLKFSLEKERAKWLVTKTDGLPAGY